MTILTKNTDKLRSEVAAHIAADSIIQGDYWDDESKCGCFIGCLAKGDDPSINEATYGLPVVVQRIAENIFEALPAAEAKVFFASLPDAVGCDNKDLTAVGWRFLAAELRALPEQSSEIQAVIDPVIAGMDLMANGQPWATAAVAATAAADVAATAVNAAYTAAATATNAAWAAAATATNAAWAAAATATNVAADAGANAGADAAWAAANVAALAGAAAAATWPAARLRQRNLLLRLIAESPVMESHQ